MTFKGYIFSNRSRDRPLNTIDNVIAYAISKKISELVTRAEL